MTCLCPSVENCILRIVKKKNSIQISSEHLSWRNSWTQSCFVIQFPLYSLPKSSFNAETLVTNSYCSSENVLDVETKGRSGIVKMSMTGKYIDFHLSRLAPQTLVFSAPAQQGSSEFTTLRMAPPWPPQCLLLFL